MKILPIYKNMGLNNEKEVFDFFIGSLKKSNTTWDFFVNWAKVFAGIEKIEIELNILNYLIGKDNFEEEVTSLLKKYPSIVKVVPILIACRQKSFEVLTDFGKGELQYKSFSFCEKNSLSDSEIGEITRFLKSSGIAELFIGKKIKNVVDYVTGIEVGIDSNGRKNRGGDIMEDIVEPYVRSICQKNQYRFEKEANAKKIMDMFGVFVPVDKTSRRFDFVVKANSQLFLIETNFYGGGGSKLKATAGEYKMLQGVLRETEHIFIWITDGVGWITTTRPFGEAYHEIDFVLNLTLLEKGALNNIIEGNL